jgi:hypothetical protein
LRGARERRQGEDALHDIDAGSRLGNSRDQRLAGVGVRRIVAGADQEDLVALDVVFLHIVLEDVGAPGQGHVGIAAVRVHVNDGVQRQAADLAIHVEIA